MPFFLLSQPSLVSLFLSFQVPDLMPSFFVISACLSISVPFFSGSRPHAFFFVTSACHSIPVPFFSGTRPHVFFFVISTRLTISVPFLSVSRRPVSLFAITVHLSISVPYSSGFRTHIFCLCYLSPSLNLCSFLLFFLTSSFLVLLCQHIFVSRLYSSLVPPPHLFRLCPRGRFFYHCTFLLGLPAPFLLSLISKMIFVSFFLSFTGPQFISFIFTLSPLSLSYFPLVPPSLMLFLSIFVSLFLSSLFPYLIFFVFALSAQLSIFFFLLSLVPNPTSCVFVLLAHI